MLEIEPLELAVVDFAGDPTSSERFVLDTATPNVGNLVARLEGGKLHVTAEAKDPASAIARAEYSIDAGPWQYIEPVGKISDATSERYDFSAPLPQPSSLWTFRT